MIEINRILKDYAETGALNALVAVHVAVDDQTFLTKGGDLVTVLRLRGADAECMESLEKDQLTRRFSSAVRIFDERFRVYQYLIKDAYGPIPSNRLGDAEAMRATADRIATLESHGLYRIEVRLAVVYEGWRPVAERLRRLRRCITDPVASLQERLSSRRTIDVLDAELARAMQELTAKLGQFQAQLRDFVQVETLDKKEAFRFFRGLLNYVPDKLAGVELAYDSYVDYQACGSTLECHRDHLRLDDEFVQVVTLKDPPAQTYAHLLKGLQELPARFIAATEWKRTGDREVRRLIQSKRRHHHNSKASLLNYLGSHSGSSKDMLIDDSAAARVHELGTSLEEIEVKGGCLGEFSLSVILHDSDPAALRRASSECFKVLGSMGAQGTDERYNLLNAFLAVLPGNRDFNLRRLWVTNANYADFSFLFAPHVGETHNAHLDTEYLSIFETNQRTPFFFNLHHSDVAHSFLLGATGSGKSFTTAYLLTHLQKFRPFTYIFDLGPSYRDLTDRFEGTYVRFGFEDSGPTINPFSLPLTPDNLQFLCRFVRVLLETGGATVSPSDDRQLFDQIQSLYEVEPQHRRLLTLSNILSRPLREGLRRWVQGGQYGTAFDQVEDTLTLARFQTFDFEAMAQAPQLLEPLLFYVLHRAQAAIGDSDTASTFKVFVVDEAWRFLRNSAIRLYVQEALKTWRKKNAAMILATQSADDLFHSELFPVIAESCPTRLLLANPGMDAAAYREAFHLSETEAETIAALIPKRQLLLKRPDFSKVLNLDLERSRTS